MYNATLFCNTGFNAINIPDSPATLNLAQAQYTVPALDIYQARELSQFVVRANYGVVKNADYLYLVNSEDSTDFAYYSVQNVTMTSKDTAVLDVTMDYILTAGGVSNLTFLDGMCERHHVAVADDVFGAYDEDDPYLTPAEMLKIETEIPNFVGSDSKNDVTILESTIDLYGTFIDANADALAGFDYTSAQQNAVTVPNVRPYEQTTAATARMTKPDDATFYVTRLPNVNFVVVNPTEFWSTQNADLGWVQSALSYVRSLGVESCIIAQYAIPRFMLNMTDNDFLTWIGSVTGQSATLNKNIGQVQYLTGAHKKVSVSSLPFMHSYSHSVINKRLYYGENCQYTITSIASGNSASFLPEEIYDSSNNQPSVEMRVDPRPDGSPYFRFTVYRGESDETSGKEDTFFINAIKGLQWQNVPLVFQGASGSLLNQYAYRARMAAGQENYDAGMNMLKLSGMRNEADFATGMTSGMLTSIGGFASGRADIGLGAIGQMIDTGMSYGFNYAQNELSKEHQTNSWNIQKNSELQSLLIQNNVVAPSMNFPISESIRDFVGNTCLVYRTYYTENDVARLDKILNMYGYRHTTPLTTALLTNRSKFNYIQARGVSVGNINLPKWIRDGVASQFAVGTRIWHQLPDVSAYTDGSNT